MTLHIARWDLDKTYLRTDFDTLKDLVRTALEKPEQKRTNPGAATLLREMGNAGIEVHILSGSPEQMRGRLERKLTIDGIQWRSLTLKPNLQNILRLRLRAMRDQLGYKLPALLAARAKVEFAVDANDEAVPHETLFGDDAEADAFVYCLYADYLAGRVEIDVLKDVFERGKTYADTALEALDEAKRLTRRDAVEHIFIHLEKQTPPDDFLVYGPRLIPFYNYLQTAFVCYEAARIPAISILRVATELITVHRFDGDALVRSYRDVARRGHLRGSGIDAIGAALERFDEIQDDAQKRELKTMVDGLSAEAERARSFFRGEEVVTPDYAKLVSIHNKRHK